MEENLLSVSVVMPVRNEALHIVATLEAALGQEYPASKLEVLVVDGDSTDNTPQLVTEVAQRDSRVELHHNPRRLSSAARNIGVKAATGDVVVIVDGHCEFPDNQYFKNLSGAFQRSGADCLGRPQTLHIDQASPLQRAIATARASRLGHNPGSFIYATEETIAPAHSMGVAYRKTVFDKVGYFDESFDACEDVEFNHRVDKAGLTCLFAPSIGLNYHPRGTLPGLFKQLGRYGCGRVRLAWKHPDTISKLTFAPTAFVAFVLLGLPLCLLSKNFALFYVGTLMAYLAVVLVFSTWICVKEKRFSMLPYLPFVFAGIHFGAGYGSFRELITGRFRKK